MIDITDRGVGMSANELAYANWRLENPPAADIDVPKWIGVFVVARLAARHGIRVRLQQAEFGGLTALVWLPDEILIHQGAAAPPRLSGSGGVGPRRGSHEAAGDLGRGTLERSAATARSAESTSPREDARGAQLSRRLISDAGHRPGPAGSADGARPVSQVGPPTTAGPSGPRLAGVGGDRYVAARPCSVRGRSAAEPGDKFRRRRGHRAADRHAETAHLRLGRGALVWRQPRGARFVRRHRNGRSPLVITGR